MLLSLNDDCLRSIGEILTLEDQISLAHVCQRLQSIVENIWFHNSRKVNLTREQCWLFTDHEHYFYEYMRCISENVEQLELGSIKSSLLHCISNLQFPKIKSFTVTTHYSSKKPNEDTKLMTKLFPHLTKLSICSSTTGQYLWEFKDLEELHLQACEDLKTKYLQKILNELNLKKLSIIYFGYNTCLDERINAITNCKTLEELFIDDHHLLLIKNDLHKLEKLRKITTYTRDYDTYLLDELCKRLGSAMETMIFNDVFWSKDEHCENVQKMINLRRLIFIEDDISDYQLHEIGQNIGNQLEEFHFVNVRSEIKNEEGFLDLLSQCENLKVFQVSNTSIDIAFVRRVSELITSQSVKRKMPLLLRCDGTRVTKADLESLLLPELLQITLDKSPIQLLTNRCFQCEWRTKKET